MMKSFKYIFILMIGFCMGGCPSTTSHSVPSIHIESSTTFIALGDSAIFTCQAYPRGKDPVTFQWQDNGYPLQALSITEEVAQGDSYSTVQWAATGELGVHYISCTATDADGYSSMIDIPITIMLGMGRWDVVGYFHTISTVIQAAALPDDRAIFVGWSATQTVSYMSNWRSSPTYIEIVDPKSGSIISTGTVNDSIERVITLADGNVLMTMPSGALLFSPTSQGFSPTGTPLWDTMHSAALRLADGDVLFVNPNRNAMIYQVLSGKFIPVGSMVMEREFLSSVLLSTGQALVGGDYPTVELYDPQIKLFTESQEFKGGDSFSSCAVESFDLIDSLPNGKALFIGQGFHFLSSSVWFVRDIPSRYIATWAVLFDSQTGTFMSAGTMTAGRVGLQISSLQDGRVLLSGGFFYKNISGGLMKTSELYYPEYKLFVPAAPLNIPRAGHVAVTLADGRVLVAGGELANIDDDYLIFGTYRGGAKSFTPTSSIEIYTP